MMQALAGKHAKLGEFSVLVGVARAARKAPQAPLRRRAAAQVAARSAARWRAAPPKAGHAGAPR